MEFNEKLKEAMAARGFTQTQLSLESGIKQPTISDYCNGKSEPQQGNKERLIRALDVDNDYFDSEEDKKIKSAFDGMGLGDTIDFEERRNKPCARVEVEDISDIIEVSKELGAIRFKLIQMVEKAREDVKYHNIADQTFLHRLEFLDELSDEEAVKMLLEEKKSREKRRNYKNRQYLIETLLKSISIKNPNAFVVKAINGKGDILKVIDELKQDETLFQQQRGQ